MTMHKNLLGLMMSVSLLGTVTIAQEPVAMTPPTETPTPIEMEAPAMPPAEAAPVAMVEPAIPAPMLPTVTVTDFASDNPNDMTHGLPELISESLVNSGLFDVFERDRLSTLMQEQKLQTSGNVDASTAISIGKLSGVQYIVTGKIMNFGRELKTFNGFGTTTQTAFYRLQAEMKLIDAQSGRILFSKTADAEEKEFSAAANGAMNTAVAGKLAGQVSKKLVSALLAQAMFQAAPVASDKVAVTIMSNPDGADVEVDGVFLGNAGTEFKITAGMHEIKISLPGYEEWAKKVEIQAGGAFKANLVKKADVRVEVDEKTETVLPPVTPVPTPATP